MNHATILVPLLSLVFSYIQTRQSWYDLTLICKSWTATKLKPCMMGQLKANRYYNETNARKALPFLQHFRFKYIAKPTLFLFHEPFFIHIRSLNLHSNGFNIRFSLKSLHECQYVTMKYAIIASLPPNTKCLKLVHCERWCDLPSSLEFLHLKTRYSIHCLDILPCLTHIIIEIPHHSTGVWKLPDGFSHAKKLELYAAFFTYTPNLCNMIHLQDLTLFTQCTTSMRMLPAGLQHLTCDASSSVSNWMHCFTALKTLTYISPCQNLFDFEREKRVCPTLESICVIPEIPKTTRMQIK